MIPFLVVAAMVKYWPVTLALLLLIIIITRRAERRRAEEAAARRRAAAARRAASRASSRRSPASERLTWQELSPAEKKRIEAQKRKAEAEAARMEKEKQLPEQRRFVAEQRRLMSDSLRYDVMQRDSFRCQICGATAKDGYKLHVDHIVPVSKGGRTEISNLRTLCERCNFGKGAKLEPAPESQPGQAPSSDAPAAPAAPGPEESAALTPEERGYYTPEEFAALVASLGSDAPAAPGKS